MGLLLAGNPCASTSWDLVLEAFRKIFVGWSKEYLSVFCFTYRVGKVFGKLMQDIFGRDGEGNEDHLSTIKYRNLNFLGGRCVVLQSCFLFLS